MTAGVNRRRALTGAAGAALGTPLLAACAGDSGGAGSSDPDKPGEVLVRTGEVPEGGGVVLPEEKLVVTQPTKGDYRAFSAVCTHQGCLVSQVTDTIECNCHQSKFAITDGAPVAGPAAAPLAGEQVRVEGGSVVRG